MFSKYLTVALRSLQKNKLYTAINIVGLGIGIGAALLIFRIVQYELSFNKNFARYDRIVRVVTVERSPEEGESRSVCIPIPAMNVMQNTIGQFEAMSRIREIWPTVTVADMANPGGIPLKKIAMTPPKIGFFAEPAFFKIFDFKWLAGDPTTALNEPATAVITQTLAEKCFDRWENALGKTVLLDNLVPVQVRGVIQDPPKHCDFPLTLVASYPTLKAHPDLYFYEENWGGCSTNNQVYALLHQADQWDAASATLAKVGEKEYKQRGFNQSKSHSLQPLSDLHYNEDYGVSGGHVISKNRLWVLTSIGILILVMACFNFINLATALASLRAKEIGVRKTLGSGRGHLIAQFMSETALTVLAALALGTALAAVFAPLLKRISDVPDELPFLGNPLVWGFLALLFLTVTLLAGLYPSLILAGFQPLRAMKSDLHTRPAAGVSIRKGLVALQFIIAHALIVGALVVVQQLNFIQSRDLGFSKELVYTFPFNSDSATIARQETLKNRLQAIPTVQAVSFTNDQPLSGNTWSNNFRFGNHSEDEKFNVALKFCDADYQKTYGFRLLAGQWLSPSDTMREAIVNMTMLQKLGISDPQEAINQPIRLGQKRLMRVVGVTEDFHTHSFHQANEPLLMTTRKEYYFEAGVKIRPENLSATTAAIQKAFDETLPEQVFVGHFLDENIARYYENESRFSATCKGFGLLAILISCLGLFGLATHAAAQRIKEIGIRKVLGASVRGITGLLAKDFLLLVLIAIVLSTPVAYYFMNKWLSDFVYRIHIQWWIFLLAGAGAMAIAFLTVCFQGVRAALSNPVESLRRD